MLPEDGDEKTASILKHYDGYGAVRLLKEQGSATLLERAVPGTPLSELVRRGEDDQATHILCDVIQKLYIKKTFVGTYVSVDELQSGFEKYLTSGNTQISQDLVKEAQSSSRSL